MKERIELAVIDPFHPRILDAIDAALPSGWSMTAAEAPTSEARGVALAKADVAFVMATPMPADLLAQARRLRFVQKLGAGVDRIDLDHCRARGVGVARLQGGNAVPVAEHTLMLMLAALRRVVALDRRTRAGEWGKEESRGVNRQIAGRRVGLVGFGAIGRQVARLLSGFGCEIVYYDPVPAPAEVEAELRVRALPLDEVVATADILSLHSPLSPETRELIDRRRIASMKPDALLVNCARGGLVDEAALVEALREGRLFGAAIDAFAAEPPIGSPLLELENVVVTPHCAGATLDNFALIVERAFANASRALAGEPLPPGDAVVESVPTPAT